MKKVGIIKRMLCLCLVFLLSINSFAAIVSDNDGSAFITKAEFDALKSSFQSQIDSYNQSIDSKIDGAIASYLAGIKLTSKFDLDNIYETYEFGQIGSKHQLMWYKTYTPEWYEQITYGLVYSYNTMSTINMTYSESYQNYPMSALVQEIDWDEIRPVFTDETKKFAELYKKHTKVGHTGNIDAPGTDNDYYAPFSQLDSHSTEAASAPVTVGLSGIKLGQTVKIAGPFRCDYPFTITTTKINTWKEAYDEQIKINPRNVEEIAINVPDVQWEPVLLSALTSSPDTWNYYQLIRYAENSSGGYKKEINGKYYNYNVGVNSSRLACSWDAGTGTRTRTTTWNGATAGQDLTWTDYFITSTSSPMCWQAAGIYKTGPEVLKVLNTGGIYPGGVNVYWPINSAKNKAEQFYYYQGCFAKSKINELIYRDLYDKCSKNDKLKFGVVVTKNDRSAGTLTITYKVSEPGRLVLYTSKDQTDGKYGTASALTPDEAFTNLGSTISAGTTYTKVFNNCQKDEYVFVMYDPDNDDATITFDSLVLDVDN